VVSSPKPTPLVPQAADLFDAGQRASLRRLGQALRPHCDVLDAAFARRLARRGLDAKQAKALAAVTLGAAARILAGRRPVAEFFEQVEYNGRRLAKLDVAPEVLLSCLADYNRRAARRLASAPVAGPLTFATVLTLSNAYYEVRERETAAFFALHEEGLAAANERRLLERYLDVLGPWCQADAAAAILWDSEAARIAAAGPVAATARPSPALLAGPALLRGSSRLAIGRNWRGRYASIWSVPLARQSVRGVLQFAFTRHYEWLPRELRLLEGALERCLTLAEKLRLVEQLAAREKQVRELAAHMVEVEEKERRRISRELHDETGQLLPYIRLQVELAERAAPEELKPALAEVRELIGRSVLEVRRIVADLSPAVLEQLGLAAAVRQLLRRFRQQYPIAVHADLAGLGPVGKSTAIVAYRLLQECCSNVGRHSSASRLNISLGSDDKRLRMRVRDDGVGFRLEEALSRSDSFGVAGMRERVALVGGTLRVHSRLGRGTSIWAELPLKAARWRAPRARC
jgi:signal transduction histidine kinase